jgi:hypothetical protein
MAYELGESLVRSAYRVLLGREAESDAVVADLAETAVGDFDIILQSFITSREFRARYEGRKNFLEGFDFTYSDDATTSKIVLEALRMLCPHRAAGYSKIRLGRNNDGGYVMLDDFDGIDAVYSLGIKDDVSWDLEIANRGLPVYQYDHTIDALPQSHALFHWSKTGIGGARSDGLLKPLHLLMQENGHMSGRDLILKCDIEGAEWEMLSTIPQYAIRKFRQVLIETHGYGDLADPDFAQKCVNGLRALTESHKVIHVHGNNNSAYCIVGGAPVPTSLELTLARVDAYDLSTSCEVFPSPIDQPSWPHRADHALGTFTF